MIPKELRIAIAKEIVDGSLSLVVKLLKSMVFQNHWQLNMQQIIVEKTAYP